MSREREREGSEFEVPAAQQADTTRAGTAGDLALEWLKSIAIALVLFLFIRSFLVEAYRIPTGSMENTLLVGDFLLVNKAVYGARIPFTDVRLPALTEPRRGDIVVFMPPHVRRQTYVKRLIGLPGDTVEMRDQAVYVDGRRLAEPYVGPPADVDSNSSAMAWLCEYLIADAAGTCRPTRDNWGPIIVPPDRFLMLGDNRADSEDSRYWGFVDRHALMGRPLVVYYSFDPTMPGRMPWATAIRWRRVGASPD